MTLLPAGLDDIALGHYAFTTVRLRDGAPLGWKQHHSRLMVACRYLGLPGPGGFDPEISEHAPAGWSLARIMVSASGEWFSVRPLPATPRPADGVRVAWTSQLIHPQLGSYKTGAYLPYRLALAEATERACFEGWLCDVDGNLADGSRSGLVLDIDGELVVPQVGLPSLTRARWMLECPSLPFTVGRPTLAGVRRARAAWLCGAGIGVVPVAEVVLATGERLRMDSGWIAPEHPQLVWPS